MKTMRTRAIAGVGALLMATGLAVAVAPTAGAQEGPPEPVDSITLCHRTNSVTNPYRQITVNVDGSDGSLGNGNNDHTSHLGDPFDHEADPAIAYPTPRNGDQWGDIIPPYQWGPNPADFFPGQNFDDDGAAIHANDCGAPPPYDPGSLQVVKTVAGDEAPEAWSFDFEGDLGSFALTDVDATTIATVVEPADYTVTETGLPDDFTLTGVDCGNAPTVEVDGGITVTVAAGDDVVCTFTNTHAASEQPEEPEGPEQPEGDVISNQTPGPEVENDVVTAAPAPVVKAETTQLAFTGNGTTRLAVAGATLVLLGAILLGGERRRAVIERS